MASSARWTARSRRRRHGRRLGDRWFVPALIVCNDCGFYARRVGGTLLARWHLAAVVAFALLAASGRLTADRLYHAAAGKPAAQPAARSVAPPEPHAAAKQPYGRLITRAAERYRLDPALLGALVATESGYDAAARSRRGAVGLTQLMPATARALGVRSRRDPSQALDGGARYLRQLLERFDGDLFLALAAYNAGPSAVSTPGAPAPPETVAFVQSVLRRYAALRPHAPAR